MATIFNMLFNFKKTNADGEQGSYYSPSRIETEGMQCYGTCICKEFDVRLSFENRVHNILLSRTLSYFGSRFQTYGKFNSIVIAVL